MKIFFRGIYYALIAGIIAIAVLLVASMFPIPGNYEVKIVLSGSMEPAIKTGSIVVIKPKDSYQVDDIITFGKDTKTDIPTTHRIISDRVQSGMFVYTTKGDANEDTDTKEVFESKVVGKVILSVPYVGYLLDFAKKPVGFVLLIVVPAAVVVIDEVGSIWKEIKKGRKKKDNRKGEEEGSGGDTNKDGQENTKNQ